MQKDHTVILEEELNRTKESLQFAEHGWKNALGLIKHYQSLVINGKENCSPQLPTKNSENELQLQIRSLKLENEKLRRQIEYTEKKHNEELIDIKKNLDYLQITTCEALEKYQRRRDNSNTSANNPNLLLIGDDDLYRNDINAESIVLRLQAVSRRLSLISESANPRNRVQIIDNDHVSAILQRQLRTTVSEGVQTDHIVTIPETVQTTFDPAFDCYHLPPSIKSNNPDVYFNPSNEYKGDDFDGHSVVSKISMTSSKRSMPKSIASETASITSKNTKANSKAASIRSGSKNPTKSSTVSPVSNPKTTAKSSSKSGKSAKTKSTKTTKRGK